jgi:hypothetical protein
MKLAHIINPVKVGPNSDLYLAQPVTFETMRRAKSFAHNRIQVDLYTTQYPEDHEILPQDFTVLPDLERSVLDVAQFEFKRKVPILNDILQCLYDASDAEYFIYTNVDIALMPYFYTAVATLLKTYDALIINRRTINEYQSIDEIPLMYADIGEKHPGYDCFVFRRDIFPKMQLGTVCLGSPHNDTLLYANIFGLSRNAIEIKDAHLTFHIGASRIWLNDKYRPYKAHNKSQWKEALLRLHKDAGPYNKSTALGRYLLDRYQSTNRASLEPLLVLDNSLMSLRLSLVLAKAKRLPRRIMAAIVERLKRFSN